MAAPAQRPNFLLIWIGVLVLVMGAGLRALVPDPAPRHGSEASGAAPMPPVQPVILEQPVPVDPDALAVPAAAPHTDQSLLVDGDATLPDFVRPAPGEAAASGPAAQLAGSAAAEHAPAEAALPQEPSRLERLQPVPLAQGSRPRPAHRDSIEADVRSRAEEALARAPVFTVSYPGSTFHGTEAADDTVSPQDEPVVTQALVVQLAPDTFRLLLVVEEPAPAPEIGRTIARDAVEESDEQAQEADSGSGAEDDPEATRRQQLVAGLRSWLESREGRGELTPARLAWLRNQLQSAEDERDPRLNRLLIADLDRRELARFLAQLAERAHRRG